MKTLTAIIAAGLFCACCLTDMPSATAQGNTKSKNYNSDTMRRNRNTPSRSSGKNMPENRTNASPSTSDPVNKNRNTNMENDQLPHGRDSSKLDTTHLPIGGH